MNHVIAQYISHLYCHVVRAVAPFRIEEATLDKARGTIYASYANGLTTIYVQNGNKWCGWPFNTALKWSEQRRLRKIEQCCLRNSNRYLTKYLKTMRLYD